MIIELAILGVLTCQLLLLLFALVAARKLMLSALKSAHSFLESPEEGKQSAFADILDSIGNRLGSAVIAHAKAWLMSQNSISVRQQKAAARTEVRESAPPLVSFLMKYAPGVGKIVDQNPELAQAAISAIQGMNQNKEAQNTANGNNGHKQGSPFNI